MLEDYIKPIPKNIINRIKNIDKNQFYYKAGQTRFYSYLTTIKNQIAKVTVACRYYYSLFLTKQVAIHFKDLDYCLVKDLNFSYLVGYYVGWSKETNKKSSSYYEDGKWYKYEDNSFDPSSIVVNNEYILKKKKYKYCGIEYFTNDKVIKYLRLYDKYPQIEYLSKMGLSHYALKKTLLQKCTNKSFCKFLYNNLFEIQKNYFDVPVIIKAFKTNKPLKEIQQIENIKKDFLHESRFTEIRSYFKNEYFKLYSYLEKNNVDKSSYRDYIIACISLNIDISETKHRYPKVFVFLFNLLK